MGGRTQSTEPAEPRVTVLAVGGTGESSVGDTRTSVSGMLAGVTAALDERFDCRWVAYPASYGPAPRLDGMSYMRSLTQGGRNLRRALDDTVGPVMLIGYSQGAVVIRNTLHDLWRAGDPVLERVSAIGFVADPHQPPGAVAGCAGWGLAGPGPDLPPGIPAHWVGIPDDAICNASSDSLLRDLADLTAAMAFGRLGDWASALWNMLRSNAFQNASRTGLGLAQMRHDVARMSSALREVLGYLPGIIVWRSVVVRNRSGGRHTSYAREPYRHAPVTDPETTGCESLAGWLQVCATFAGFGCADVARECA
ncbi:PE-PPE domain-containing protein [Gordonia rhizosphera]|uniref:PE-PPE domain-containing protein n=1 Tax=Gordonia rhizosphera NBRC 16068 TaxID=1108045 RepID=K6WPI1_9ACTN|nr:PE-PPE domain-containing protein [Gordonia rhizosphera]GAB88444.1 hypothetical protein GORHZ_023_00020 [Gordonia rhizosphera NBRC 16068]